MQFALLVAAVVALLLSAFIALTHMHSFFGIRSNELLELIESTNQKVFESIATSSIQQDTIATTLGKISTKTHITYHGAWLRTNVVSQLHKTQFTKSALFGSVQDNSSPNLYLSNNNSPLIVVGTTRIEGNSFLPKTDVRAGTIAGNYYQGGSLVFGNIRESTEALPELEASWRPYLQFLIGNSILQNDSIREYKENQKRSFLKSQRMFYSTGLITINSAMQGNCIIKSASKITVNASATLNDVILIAPEINFQTGFKGTVQAVATRKIEIENEVILNYPSSLVVLKEVDKKEVIDHTAATSTISIAANAEINGSVVFLKKKEKDEIYTGVRNDIFIATNGRVVGEVYCEGNLELSGTVRGAVYAKQFIANQYGSIYVNHIYNGRVLKNPVKIYSGLPFKKRANIISKWLY